MSLRRALACFTLACFAAPSWAGVGKVSSPSVTQGEFEIEHSTVRYEDGDGSALQNKQRHVTEFEYGVSDVLKFGIATAFERESSQPIQGQEFALEAYYQSTSQGDYWLASGGELEYSHALHHADADAVEGKILLQRRQGPFLMLANLSAERQIGEGRTHGIEMGSALQARYAFHRRLHPGVEWHGSYGPLDDLKPVSEQEHYLGPILAGDIAQVGRGELNYVAGYYWGITDVSARRAGRVQLGYEIGF